MIQVSEDHQQFAKWIGQIVTFILIGWFARGVYDKRMRHASIVPNHREKIPLPLSKK